MGIGESLRYSPSPVERRVRVVLCRRRAYLGEQTMPSRMTCAQLIESLLGNLCAIRGTHFDATMFKKVDIESIAEELEQYGFNRYGYERMISGITGEYMDTLIFFGPTYYQRLQKFVADAEYSVRHALTDAVTMQPLDQIFRSKSYLNIWLVYVQ